MGVLCAHFFLSSFKNPHYKTHPHFQTQNVTLVSLIRRVL